MSHAYICSRFHIVFSTTERRPIIPADLQPRLWAYLAGIANHHGMSAIAVGGTADHAHALVSIPANVSLSKAVQTLKANSSRWVGEQGIRFAWQRGYGAFSVSASATASVVRYIERQTEHHKRRSFEDELRALLIKHGVPFEEKYLFA